MLQHTFTGSTRTPKQRSSHRYVLVPPGGMQSNKTRRERDCEVMCSLAAGVRVATELLHWHSTHVPCSKSVSVLSFFTHKLEMNYITSRQICLFTHFAYCVDSRTHDCRSLGHYVVRTIPSGLWTSGTNLLTPAKVVLLWNLTALPVTCFAPLYTQLYTQSLSLFSSSRYSIYMLIDCILHSSYYSINNDNISYFTAEIRV